MPGIFHGKSAVPEAVGEDGKLVGVAEMGVGVELFYIETGSGAGRHETTYGEKFI